MKESERIKKASAAPAQKKGFYYALFGSVAVMLMIAAVIGYRNLNPAQPDQLAATTPNPWEDSQAQGVNAARDNPLDSYLTPQDKTGIAATASPVISEAGLDLILPKNNTNEQGIVIDSLPPEDPMEDELAKLAPRQSEAPKAADPEPSPTAATEAPTQSPAKISEETQTQEFTAFDGSKMEWPIFGEVVMDYSMDHLVYDKTLEHYRTNSSICIAAEIGTQVKSSADGRITDVFTSRENGKSVTIDHGNGWTTTYSQLQDNVLVQVGDVVKTGQVIGGVGNPSIYALMLGSHLSFSVANENSFVNPREMLRD